MISDLVLLKNNPTSYFLFWLNVFCSHGLRFVHLPELIRKGSCDFRWHHCGQSFPTWRRVELSLKDGLADLSLGHMGLPRGCFCLPRTAGVQWMWFLQRRGPISLKPPLELWSQQRSLPVSFSLRCWTIPIRTKSARQTIRTEHAHRALEKTKESKGKPCFQLRTLKSVQIYSFNLELCLGGSKLSLWS